MLSFNIKRVFALREIPNPYTFLVKNGFSRPTAWNLINNNTTQIKTKYLELLCELLNCEPSDLYEWTPAKNARNVESHPLKGLRRKAPTQRLRTMIRSMPLNKIEEMFKDLPTGD